MNDRIANDDEATELLPLMVELAALIEPPVAERLTFGVNRDAPIRECVILSAQVDLVRLARWVHNATLSRCAAK